MKSRRIWLGRVGRPLLAVIAVGLVASATIRAIYQPRGEKSGFLENYNPESVIDRYRVVGEPANYSRGAGDSHQKFTGSFEGHFIIESRDRSALIAALRDDVFAKLGHYGAQSLSQTGDAQEGFRIEYKLGKSVGTVTISPIEIRDTLHREQFLAKGNVEVVTQIDQAEKWNP